MHRTQDRIIYLKDIIDRLGEYRQVGTLDIPVKGITCDSRKVRIGYVYASLKGAKQDGRIFIAEAIRRGAVALLTEDDLPMYPGISGQLIVADARKALAYLSSSFFGDPSSHLDVVGVTGTNGKTTVSFMIRDILRFAGRRPGMLGTVQYEMGQRIIPAVRTTPESVDNQMMMHQMVMEGCDSAVIEVSSHALMQHRAAGIDFKMGVFTNLTPEHLDYHKSMDAYFEAKCRFFEQMEHQNGTAQAVINISDDYGRRLADAWAYHYPCVTYGLDPCADVAATEIKMTLAGTAFQLKSPWGRAAVQIKMPGLHNVSNALAAIATSGNMGVSLANIVEALAGMECVPGRLEAVPNDHELSVFVDYAHTPDALQNVVHTLRAMQPSRLIVVFGCGGDRDRTKRPLMGQVVAASADIAILTNDNPRSENPDQIAQDVLQGVHMSDVGRVIKMLNRSEAIHAAIGFARPGDIVLIAGKGHEKYQEVNSVIQPFDDRDEAMKAVAKWEMPA
ncbi:MAG: UDP-N-acetylmuramoyl-L-alanyl-D-glutamate--2,6-diaminopimelate ligase [Spartobacteria bacterium]|nr:UDP-N-acetylmuramoyl-L-alanyl-D-glutamate--2,6-diaminopimelate ligase [Spartobacteria bacterium]